MSLNVSLSSELHSPLKLHTEDKSIISNYVCIVNVTVIWLEFALFGFKYDIMNKCIKDIAASFNGAENPH